MTYTQFVEKYLGKQIDWDKAYGGQCVDVYRQYCNDLGFKQSPGVVGAVDIWTSYIKTDFDKVANSATGVPPQGSVVIWDKSIGPYGHVAVCDSGTTKSFKSIDQNWPTDGGTGVVHYVTHNYNGVLGWLIPKIKVLEETMTDNEKILLDFIKTNQITEGQLREGFAYVKDGTVAKQSKEIADLKKLAQDLADRVSVMESEIKANNDLILSWQSEVSSAKGSISKLQADLKSMSDEKNVWKNRYEQKLTETADKMTVNQLFKLIVKKLTSK